MDSSRQPNENDRGEGFKSLKTKRKLGDLTINENKNPNVRQARNYNERNSSVDNQIDKPEDDIDKPEDDIDKPEDDIDKPEDKLALFFDYQNNKRWLKPILNHSKVKSNKIWLYIVYGSKDNEITKLKESYASKRNVIFKEESSTRKNSADLKIVRLMCKWHAKLPPSVNFRVISGDNAFRVYIPSFALENRLLEVISPHLRPYLRPRDEENEEKKILKDIFKTAKSVDLERALQLKHAIESAAQSSKTVFKFQKKSVTLNIENNQRGDELQFDNTVSSDGHSFDLGIYPEMKEDVLEFIMTFIIETLIHTFKCRITIDDPDYCFLVSDNDKEDQIGGLGSTEPCSSSEEQKKRQQQGYGARAERENWRDKSGLGSTEPCSSSEEQKKRSQQGYGARAERENWRDKSGLRYTGPCYSSEEQKKRPQQGYGARAERENWRDKSGLRYTGPCYSSEEHKKRPQQGYGARVERENWRDKSGLRYTGPCYSSEEQKKRPQQGYGARAERENWRDKSGLRYTGPCYSSEEQKKRPQQGYGARVERENRRDKSGHD